MPTIEPRGEALCVRVLWGERRVATHLVHPGRKLALTSTGEVVTEAAPFQFEAGDRHFSLAFQEGMTGELLRNGETPLSLGEAVHRGLAVEEQKGWSFEIGRADVLRLGNGPVSVEAFRVRAPPKALGTLEDSVDFRFLNTLLVCFAIFFGLAVQAQLSEASEDDGLVQSDVTRMRNILVKAEEPPRKIRSIETATEVKPKKQTVAEGKPRPPVKPVKDTGGVTNPMPTAKQLMGAIFAGSGANNVLGPGGLGKELKGALGNVVASNGDGLGGYSIRGNSAGGVGGDPVGIGAIPISGTSKKTGIGLIGKKDSLGPTIDPEPPVFCMAESGGCMDKDLIRKVINGHRDQIRFCYELALQQAPSLAGKVAVQFAVASSGSVAAARVESSSARSDALSDCLVSRVRTWHFPVGRAGNGYRVTYPFVFKPSGA